MVLSAKCKYTGPKALMFLVPKWIVTPKIHNPCRLAACCRPVGAEHVMRAWGAKFQRDITCEKADRKKSLHPSYGTSKDFASAKGSVVCPPSAVWSLSLRPRLALTITGPVRMSSCLPMKTKDPSLTPATVGSPIQHLFHRNEAEVDDSWSTLTLHKMVPKASFPRPILELPSNTP